MLILQKPLGLGALKIMNGGEMVAEYFFARIWAVPAGVLLFGLNGWLTGMQNAVIPMVVAIVVNLLHIACSLLFAFRFDMGITGIAYASVVAQWTGVALTAIITWWRYSRELVRITWSGKLSRSSSRSTATSSSARSAWWLPTHSSPLPQHAWTILRYLPSTPF